MNVVIIALGISALFLMGRHVYCAYKFGSTMMAEVGPSWSSRRDPKPIAFSYSDLKRFKLRNKELIDSNAVVYSSVDRFEKSWKYGMPMILVLAVVAAILQRLILFI